MPDRSQFPASEGGPVLARNRFSEDLSEKKRLPENCLVMNNFTFTID
jgi:hypothetical protein